MIRIRTLQLKGDDNPFEKVLVTQDVLNRINEQHALVPLAEDQVYVRKFRLAHNQQDLMNEKFSPALLRKFAKDANVGRSMLIGHNYRSSPIGRVFEGYTTEENGTMWLMGTFYTPIIAENNELRSYIDAGVFKDVSIGFFADTIVCSVCGVSMKDAACHHYPGQTVDGKTVIGMWDVPGEMVESSIVYMGAQPGAQLVKNLIPDEDSSRWPVNSATKIYLPVSNILKDRIFTSVAEITKGVNDKINVCHYFLGNVSTPQEPELIGKDVIEEYNIIGINASLESTIGDDLKLMKLIDVQVKVWDETDNQIKYRIKDPSLFISDSFSTEIMHGVKGISMIMGKLKSDSKGSMVIQSLAFKKPEWTMEKAKAWVKAHPKLQKLYDETINQSEFFLYGVCIEQEINGIKVEEWDMDDSDKTEIVEEYPIKEPETVNEEVIQDKAASGSLSLPLAPENTAWSFTATDANAILGVKKGEQDKNADWSKYASVHFWKDPAQEDKRAGYKLPFAKIIDGSIKAVWHGVAAANVVIQGGRGGADIPAADRPAIISKIKHYYKRFGKPFPSDSSGKELSEDIQYKFSDIVWNAGEDFIFELLEANKFITSLSNILTHWVKEERDLSPIITTVKDFLVQYSKDDAPTTNETAVPCQEEVNKKVDENEFIPMVSGILNNLLNPEIRNLSDDKQELLVDENTVIYWYS